MGYPNCLEEADQTRTIKNQTTIVKIGGAEGNRRTVEESIVGRVEIAYIKDGKKHAEIVDAGTPIGIYPV